MCTRLRTAFAAMAVTNSWKRPDENQWIPAATRRLRTQHHSLKGSPSPIPLRERQTTPVFSLTFVDAKKRKPTALLYVEGASCETGLLHSVHGRASPSGEISQQASKNAVKAFYYAVTRRSSPSFSPFHSRSRSFSPHRRDSGGCTTPSTKPMSTR